MHVNKKQNHLLPCLPFLPLPPAASIALSAGGISSSVTFLCDLGAHLLFLETGEEVAQTPRERFSSSAPRTERNSHFWHVSVIMKQTKWSSLELRAPAGKVPPRRCFLPAPEIPELGFCWGTGRWVLPTLQALEVPAPLPPGSHYSAIHNHCVAALGVSVRAEMNKQCWGKSGSG